MRSHARWCPRRWRKGLRVVDLSGAWRLKQEQHRAIYGFRGFRCGHRGRIHRERGLRIARIERRPHCRAALVANPGCYATSVILALAPLLKAGVVDRNRGIISDSKSGVSRERAKSRRRKRISFRWPTICPPIRCSITGIWERWSSSLGWERQELIFTPHLLPIPRGILSTIYVHLNRR